MAAKKKAAKAGVSAGSSVAAAYTSPYVQRLIQDPSVRDDLRTALDAGRSAYARVNNGKAPAKVVLEDKRFQKDLRQASDSLRTVSEALREGPKGSGGGGGGLGIVRLLLLLLVGGGVALGVSEGLRNKVLDLLFGAEEEFDYTSTTTPATTPVTPAAATTVVPETPEAASGTVGT